MAPVARGIVYDSGRIVAGRTYEMMAPPILLERRSATGFGANVVARWTGFNLSLMQVGVISDLSALGTITRPTQDLPSELHVQVSTLRGRRYT